MKIGINASFLQKPDTGIGQVTINFINELIKLPEFKIQNSKFKIKEVDFFLYLEADINFKLPKNFHKRVFLPPWKRDDLIRKIWWEKCQLPKMAAKDGCETFISPYQCPTILPAGMTHKMLVHDMIPEIFPEYLDNWRKKIYYSLTKRAVQKADTILTVSEWSKKDVHKYLKIPEKKIRVAYPSVGAEFFEKGDLEKDNKILDKYGVFGRYIFYIGGFDVRKNIPQLIEAYAEMRKRYDINDVNLVLAGEDKSRYSRLFTDLNAEIEKHGLGGKVKIAGFVKQKDLPALYRNAEFYILPSLYEGFGLMALEAFASGTPALLAKNSSLLEVGGGAALFFNPHDSEEMSRVMGKVLRNGKLRHHLAEKGKSRAKKFSWKNFVEKILEE
ncbi:MAG: glycosyltransferase family 1 protein [Candidatus Moranbacteria bacterium]|nr:glycosyltransferase family 1 protein [Candidatus Moranbacteria bacterium]